MVSESGTIPAPRPARTPREIYDVLERDIAAIADARDGEVLRRAMQLGIELGGLTANARPVVPDRELRELLVETLRFAQRSLFGRMQGIA